MKKGFTLIELLVVVLIIGILTAVALPKYQTAINKSRYAKLMPLGKSIKNAEEVMYMARGGYSDELDELDVHIPGTVVNNKVTNAEGTELTVTADSDHSYVRVVNDKVPSALVMYFDKSKNFPGEIHCEVAKEGDEINEKGKQVCLSYGPSNAGAPIVGTDANYVAYILEGTGNGTGSGVSTGEGTKTVTYSGPCRREVGGSYCTEIEYDDGIYELAYCVNNQCEQATGVYGSQGEFYPLTDQYCSGNLANGEDCNPYAYEEYEYDDNYSHQTYGLMCESYDDTGKCTEGMTDWSTYNEDGEWTYHKECEFNETGNCITTMLLDNFVYGGEYGKMVSYRYCESFDDGGSCQQFATHECVNTEWPCH